MNTFEKENKYFLNFFNIYFQKFNCVTFQINSKLVECPS